MQNPGLRGPHSANQRLAPSYHPFLRWQLGEETRQSNHKSTPPRLPVRKRATINALARIFLCVGATCSLGFCGLRNCLLASIRDSEDTHTEQFFTPPASRFPLSRYHTCPIERRVIWHTFIPSTPETDPEWWPNASSVLRGQELHSIWLDAFKAASHPRTAFGELAMEVPQANPIPTLAVALCISVIGTCSLHTEICPT
jgi:hypothetical protein